MDGVGRDQDIGDTLGSDMGNAVPEVVFIDCVKGGFSQEAFFWDRGFSSGPEALRAGGRLDRRGCGSAADPGSFLLVLPLLRVIADHPAEGLGAAGGVVVAHRLVDRDLDASVENRLGHRAGDS